MYFAIDRFIYLCYTKRTETIKNTPTPTCLLIQQTSEEMNMWDYSFMFPSVIILFTLLVFYFSRPRLSIRMNRTYLGMLLLEISAGGG